MNYEFDEKDAYAFVSMIQAHTDKKGSELFFEVCPYCHKTDKDNKYKFSINLKTGQFQCKRASCGAKGNMITLAKDFNFSLGNNIDIYHHIKEPRFLKPRPVPEYVPSDPVEAYMLKRGISAEIVARYRLKSVDDKPNVMAIPFINEEGLLENVKYRKLDFDKTKDKNKEWFAANCKPILFGMAQCKTKDRLVITEGQMDAMALAEAGIDNPVSVPNGANGFTWVPHCWNWINDFSEIVVFGDCEKGHVTLIDKIAEHFKHKKVYRIREVDYQGQKDANDILLKAGKEALVDAVNNAVLMTSGRIKDFSSVEMKDLSSIECIKTGFPSLDKAMLGGFQLGTFNVITGKRGDGKSTFVSQIMANALDQNYKTFIYSGELNDYMVKNWLVQQLSGFHFPPMPVREKVDVYLKDRAYLYDMTVISDEMNDIVPTLKEAVLKYDCKLLIVDNLMSAIDAGTDLYGAQAEFCKKLSEIAISLNVVVLLIAHPKKNQNEDLNDSISGSSNITDRASYVLSYDRDKNLEDDKRKIAISKNRLDGTLLLNRGANRDDRIICVYDSTNKRITETGVNQASHEWDAEFVNVEELKKEDMPEDIPF